MTDTTKEVTTADLRTMLRVAGAVVTGTPLRIPIGLQIRGLANTSLHLRDVLQGCVDGDAESIAAARDILG